MDEVGILVSPAAVHRPKTTLTIVVHVHVKHDGQDYEPAKHRGEEVTGVMAQCPMRAESP